MAYKQTNSRGTTYYLNVKEIEFKNQSTRLLYFFSKDERPDTAIDLPEGYEVSESKQGGLLFLRKVR